jgi:hypothetical protein
MLKKIELNEYTKGTAVLADHVFKKEPVMQFFKKEDIRENKFR